MKKARGWAAVAKQWKKKKEAKLASSAIAASAPVAKATTVEPSPAEKRSFRGDTSTTSVRDDMSTNSGTSSVRSTRRAESSTRHRDDDNRKPSSRKPSSRKPSSRKPSSRSKSTARKPSPVPSRRSRSRNHHSSSRPSRGDRHESQFRDDDDSTRHGSSKKYQDGDARNDRSDSRGRMGSRSSSRKYGSRARSCSDGSGGGHSSGSGSRSSRSCSLGPGPGKFYHDDYDHDQYDEESHSHASKSYQKKKSYKSSSHNDDHSTANSSRASKSHQKKESYKSSSHNDNYRTPPRKSYHQKKSYKSSSHHDDHSAASSARTGTFSRDESPQRSRAKSSHKNPPQDSHKKRSGGHSSSHHSDHSIVTSINTNATPRSRKSHSNNDRESAPYTVPEEHSEDSSELSIPKTDSKPKKQESPLKTKEQILQLAIQNSSLNELASANTDYYFGAVQDVSTAKEIGTTTTALVRNLTVGCHVHLAARAARKAIIQKEADKHNEAIEISKDKVEEKKLEVDEKKARIEQAKDAAQTEHSELGENLTRKISEIHTKKEEEQRRIDEKYATKEAAAIDNCASKKKVIDANLEKNTSSLGAEVKQGEKDHVKLEKEVNTNIKHKAETVDAAQKHINVVDSGAACIISFHEKWALKGEEQGQMDADTMQSLSNEMDAHMALMMAYNSNEEDVKAEKGVDPNVQAKEAAAGVKEGDDPDAQPTTTSTPNATINVSAPKDEATPSIKDGGGKGTNQTETAHCATNPGTTPTSKVENATPKDSAEETKGNDAEGEQQGQRYGPDFEGLFVSFIEFFWGK